MVLGAVLLILATPANSQTRTPKRDSPDYPETGQQSSGIIMGTILDQTGAVAAGARVRLSRDTQSQSQEIVSGDNGQFSFSNVTPGHFKITVTAASFSTQEFSGDLLSGQAYLVPPIVLVLATAKTEVTVGVSTVEVAEAQIREQEKQRVLGIIPNFYVSYVPDAAPLDTKQKFELALKVALDPVTFAGVGALAGFQQAGDDLAYGQGAQGYAKRYGAAYGNTVAAIFIGNAILPSLLKQDPRYFYQGTGSTRSRLLHALSSSVICKGDNKRWQPNYSSIIGSLAAGGISNLYYPASNRNGAGFVFENAFIRIGQDSLGGVLQEFIVRRLTPHGRHEEPAQP